jgi:alpha-L-fucosidase 2
MEGSTIADRPGDNRPEYRLLPPQMKWQSKVKIIHEGGILSSEDNNLVLKNADAATLILAGATNWAAWNDVSANEKKRCGDYISKASKLSYKKLLQRHLDDYCPLFSACRIDLGADLNPSRTTTQSMDAIRTGEFDHAYEARYFQYARYLMLAGAREKTLAFNNHNMWLNDLTGRWNGRWTLNININECYWPVESTNLPRVNESLLYFVEQLAQAGTRTAKELFDCRGWCAHHGTDVWFNTAPTDGNPRHAVFPVSGMWLMQQLYDHYLYDPDPEYLRRIYPLLKGSVEFCHDFLVKDPVSGYMLTCPSASPENEFIDDKGNKIGASLGASGDNQIIRRLLRNFIEASSILKTDAEMSKRSAEILEQLPPHQIGSFGQLQEWLYDFKEVEVTHRHTSHLWAVYPDDDITIRKTPELAEAAKVVLQRRGDINMGWSGAWKINLHARFEEPEKAYGILHKMLTDVSIHPSPEDSRVTPSFEGNQAIQGVAAGMTEMLIQSHSSELSLLPALPAQWKNGAVTGLRARGGFDVEIAWKDNVLTKAVVKAHYDKYCRLRTKSPVQVFSSGKEIKITSLGENLIGFEAKAGKEYEVRQTELTGLAGLDPAKTAIIIIDMWNFHWCMTAAERVSAMVPRMNAVLDIARKQGMQIIWNPSDVVTAYSGYPQYEKALAVEHHHTPEIRTEIAAKFTAPFGACLCGPGFRCGGNYGWDGMNPDLIIGDSDLISASTDEIYSLLSERGITNVIYMGVHTNMCVFGKPGAISYLWKAGFNCLLARDLNDAFTAYDPDSGYTPDQGTTEIDENLQTAGITIINMGEEFRKAGLLKSDVPLDFVRFAPWGKPERPYLMEKKIIVTLTAPWLEETEIHYTADESEPTLQSPLYTAPLEISQTTVLRAAAFRKGKQVSLPSSAFYAAMPAIPAKPSVYLEDLKYTPNAYAPSYIWQPKKGESFEGKPLRVSRKSYIHGMGFRAPSSVQYEIKPEYKQFVALAGIDENIKNDNNGRFVAMHSSVVFRIVIDGKLMAESPVMRISQEPWRFDVEIPKGSRSINLVCMDAGSRNLLDYGNWVDAGFITQ